METALQILALVIVAAHCVRLGCSSINTAYIAYQTLSVTSLLLSILTLTFIHGL